MTFLPWSDEYRVGIRVIDNDHRALFDLINALHDNIQRGEGELITGSTLTALIRYVGKHFPNEERYMKQCGYPDYTRHAAEHENFAQTVRHYKKLFDENPRRMNTDNLFNLLKNWVTTHILEADMKMVPYLRGEKTDRPRSRR